jgi:hypothetical protein
MGLIHRNAGISLVTRVTGLLIAGHIRGNHVAQRCVYTFAKANAFFMRIEASQQLLRRNIGKMDMFDYNVMTIENLVAHVLDIFFRLCRPQRHKHERGDDDEAGEWVFW